ncbi:ZP domain-containing protein [Caenorhabditis elegans]|nr:ZP domain-containing protein [Caenorhabditis elegans]SMQ44705.1 ZP domain-containing protein [Caenorhabditis elegans]|eukprot:NP_001338853.1 Uncharacterized protein CELE_F10D7.4 [Caenorhabditis elegans]
MFECLAPKSVSVLNFEGTDFVRRNPDSMFCHIRFTRPMVEGDNLELKVVFHDTPMFDGQCLLSITPPELQDYRAKVIVDENPYIIDPTTAWISYMKDDDCRKVMRFGMMFTKGALNLRLPGDTEFFTFYHVPRDCNNICVDLFFCNCIKAVALRDPDFSMEIHSSAPKIYRNQSLVIIP